MTSKRILILGLYPIVRAQHGGSRRARAAVQEYSRQFSHTRYCAVFSRASFPQHALSDIPVSMETDQAVVKDRELEDIIVGKAIFDDPKVKARVTKLLRSFQPDLIQVEQVYAYLGLKPLLAELGLTPHLIYDAPATVNAAINQGKYKSSPVRVTTAPSRTSSAARSSMPTPRPQPVGMLAGQIAAPVPHQQGYTLSQITDAVGSSPVVQGAVYGCAKGVVSMTAIAVASSVIGGPEFGALEIVDACSTGMIAGGLDAVLPGSGAAIETMDNFFLIRTGYNFFFMP